MSRPRSESMLLSSSIRLLEKYPGALAARSKESRSPREGTRPTRFPRKSTCIVGPVPSPGGFFNRLTRINVVSAEQSAVPPDERCDPPQHDHQNDGQTEEA